MTRRRRSPRSLLFVFVLCGAPSAVMGFGPVGSVGGGGQEQVYRFEAGVDLVSVAVAVLDEEGRFVSDLAVDDFRIVEDGVEQEIVAFGAGLDESWVDLPPEEKEALSRRQVIGLLLDSSGSMEEDLPLVHEAAIKFLLNVPRTEHLLIVNFDENIRISEFSSDDQRTISNRIYEIEAEGWTSLYDATAAFLDRVFEYSGTKTLVVFSDGMDSRSSMSFGETLDFVKASDTTIHSIQFGSTRRQSEAFAGSRFLRAISSESGGSFERAHSLDGLDEIYDRILDALYSQYSLGYVSTNRSTDGGYRRIEVEVGRRDLGDLDVRARRGYYGPYVEETPPPPPVR